MFDDLPFATSLGSDNHAGVHPRIWDAMAAANRGHAHAYGKDDVCALADHEFRRVFGDSVDAQYVFTGTAANVLSFAGLVPSFGAVICSDVAHLHLDECGAPEKFLGAKLWTLPSSDGRIFPDQVREHLARRGDQHYAQPRIVSLTQPTELGCCYSLDELHAWREFTTRENLMLHIDGARLANAAVHLQCELRDLTLGADVVSFGATKNGAMAAESVLLFTEPAKLSFKYYRKQAMQLSSKTRFFAAQYWAYLKGDLWREIAAHTTSTALQLRAKLREFPEIELAFPVESNALFVRLPKNWIHPLREKFFFYIWDVDQNLARWMISFDWTEATTDQLLSELREVKRCFPVK